MNKKILIIEDDTNIVELLKFNLEANGYDVQVAYDGKQGIDSAININPDLVLLDIMMPIIDGIEVLNRLQRENATKNIPIIMLTAKSSEMDKIIGLEIGADDYVTKPFSISELIARVKAHIRRSERNKESKNNVDKILNYNNIVMNLEKFEVYKNDNLIKLSLKEFELLKILLENQGKVLTRNQLLDEIWGYDFFGETRTVDVHIRHLRSKLDDNDDNSIIRTIRGIGYSIK